MRGRRYTFRPRRGYRRCLRCNTRLDNPADCPICRTGRFKPREEPADESKEQERPEEPGEQP